MQCIRSRWPRRWAAHGPGSGASPAQSWAEVRLGVGEPLLEQLCDRTRPRSALLTRLDDQRGEGPRLVPQSVLATASPSTQLCRPRTVVGAVGPARPPAHGSRCQHTVFGHHRVHLGLEPRAQDDELGPIAAQLPQLPGRRRGDPRLGSQPRRSMSARSMASRSWFFTRRCPELRPLGVGQMDSSPVGLQQVDHPVPPIGGLDHHLGIRARLCHRRRDGQRIIGDPSGRELLARRADARSPTGGDESRYRRTVDP
jgi:hypothetical protein